MAADPDKLELVIGGKAYGGWTGVAVTLALDGLASSFALELTTRDPESGVAEWTINAGDECRVQIGGETVITGYLDSLTSDLSAGAHRINAAGRSKAADLIDCSAVVKAWANQKLDAIVRDLIAPFGLSLTVKGDTGAPFKKFATQAGETVFEAIERMLKMRGLLAVSDAEGNLVVLSPKPVGPAVRIEQGQHFEAVAGRHDVSQRFSDYLIKGQAAGDDDHNGKAVSQVKASATDPGIKRHRPLTIVAEDQATTATLQARAKWEATVRAAKAQGADVTMPGWRDPDEKLWAPMRLVRLVAPAAWIDADMMIGNIAFSLNEGGSTAVLSLAYPEAYSQQPVPPEAKPSRIEKKGRRQ